MTAYEMRMSGLSSDVCSSDLSVSNPEAAISGTDHTIAAHSGCESATSAPNPLGLDARIPRRQAKTTATRPAATDTRTAIHCVGESATARPPKETDCSPRKMKSAATRSEEHTSELQALMRNSYAVFCLKKKNTN